MGLLGMRGMIIKIECQVQRLKLWCMKKELNERTDESVTLWSGYIEVIKVIEGLLKSHKRGGGDQGKS